MLRVTKLMAQAVIHARHFHKFMAAISEPVSQGIMNFDITKGTKKPIAHTISRKLIHGITARLSWVKKRSIYFLLPIGSFVMCISTYGSWADLFAKAARKHGVIRSQEKAGVSSQSRVPEKLSATPRQVFIKASSIYWGDVSDITKPEVFYSHKIHLTSPKQLRVVTGDEVLKEIKDDLRQALRKFEKQNNVKVVWDAPGKGCPDVTAAFIDFFDKECQHAGSSISPLTISLREEQ